jgi:hypothetical protein
MNPFYGSSIFLIRVARQTGVLGVSHCRLTESQVKDFLQWLIFQGEGRESPLYFSLLQCNQVVKEWWKKKNEIKRKQLSELNKNKRQRKKEA